MEMEKERRVKIMLLSIILIFSSYHCTFAQYHKMKVIFNSGVEEETFYHFILNDLQKGLKVDKCTVAFGTFTMTIKNNKVDSTLILGNLPKHLEAKIAKRIKQTDGMWRLHLLNIDKPYNVVLHVFLIFTNDCDSIIRDYGNTLDLVHFSESNAFEFYDNFLLSENHIMALPILIDDSIKR